jgi:D-alanine-D-alanine ligase
MGDQKNGSGSMTKDVALLVGGWSAERDVSLTKGRQVEQALKDGGYAVRWVEVSHDIQKLLKDLTPRPDVVFNNLHGQGGEDGVIQGLLEILQIPYTHSGLTASAIGMNKPLSKRMAASVGVPSAEGRVATKEEVLSGKVMQPPYVVKPPCEGSSVGVRLILDNDNHPAIDEAWTFGNEVLVERYIPGKELTVAVLDGRAQAVTEIVSHTRFFDYEAKYKDTRTELVLPADISKDVYNKAMDYAERVYKVLGCSGLARCDFRYDDSQKGTEGLYFLEINTQPGLTAESIGPSQVVYNGKSFVELCSHLVETAQCHATAQDAAPSSNDARQAQSA